MRQKDFNEIARVLGNELRTCDGMTETDGLLVALHAIAGHAKDAYPEVNLADYYAHHDQAYREGM